MGREAGGSRVCHHSQPVPLQPRVSTVRRHLRRILVVLAVLAALVAIAPLGMLAWLHASAGGRIVSAPAELPELEAACLMGARVYGPGEPSPVAGQRVEASAALASARPGLRFVVSGHEPANQEATELALALVRQGVAADRIGTDPQGSTTLANVHSMAALDGPVVFVTQGFHLPRTLWMARQQGLDAWGLEAEAVAPTDPGVGPTKAILIRARRHLREGVLALLHLLGLYEGMSEG
jgi:SanA protein